MQKITLCQGLPASGKTTWSKEYCEKHLDTIRVCRDDLRIMRGKYWNPKQEDLITVLEHACIRQSLLMGYNVIVDATNLNKSYLNDIIQIATEYDAIIEFKSFLDVSVEECIRRDLKRPNSVGEKVIRQFYNRFLRPKYEVIKDKSLPHAIICDLDGTLAIHNGRSPYDAEKCDTDLVNEVIYDIIERYYDTNKHIIFVSGRQDKVKEKTVNWLNEIFNYPEYQYLLYMRKTGDNRNDAIIKREIFMEHINGKFTIDFVLDDRLRVCRMWYSELGLTVLRVGDPDADF